MSSHNSVLRRCEDNLNVSGIGVILLSAWETFKVIMQILMSAKDSMNRVTAAIDGQEWKYAIVLVLILIGLEILLIALILVIHLYIGRNASRNAKGYPYKKGYYVWAIILLVLSVLGMYFYVDKFQDLENIGPTIASVILDITYIYLLGIVIISSRKLKALRQSVKQE